ncbi:MAG: hypothetical protein ACE5DK_01830 [Paracoccaceae bacterium]
MSDFELTRQHIRAGTYRATLSTKARIKGDPVLELRFLNEKTAPVSIERDPGAKKTWNVSAEIPASAISDGVQTFLIRDTRSGETLDRFAIAAGIPLQGDLSADVGLLRAELDLLKAAFRKHCTSRKRSPKKKVTPRSS